MPTSVNIKNGVGKHSLKSSMESYLPHDVLYRKKMGFAVPLADWFRGPLKERLYDGLLSKQMRDSGFFDHKQIKHLIDSHVEGIRDNSSALWTLLMFESFLRQNMES